MGGGGTSGIAKSKSKTKTSSAAADKLAAIAEQFASETEGIRTGLIDTMQEVLSTGGSSVPIISSAVESSKRAASQTSRQTDEDLARSGLAGTPFGEAIRASQRQEGNIAANQTQQQLAQQIFSGISNFVLGQSQTATSGLSSAISGMNTVSSKGKGSSHAIAGGYNYKGGTAQPSTSGSSTTD